MCLADAITFGLQTPAKEQANLGIVVDNKYVSLGHGNAAPVGRKNFILSGSNVKVSPKFQWDIRIGIGMFLSMKSVAPPKTNSLIRVCP